MKARPGFDEKTERALLTDCLSNAAMLLGALALLLYMWWNDAFFLPAFLAALLLGGANGYFLLENRRKLKKLSEKCEKGRESVFFFVAHTKNNDIIISIVNGGTTGLNIERTGYWILRSFQKRGGTTMFKRIFKTKERLAFEPETAEDRALDNLQIILGMHQRDHPASFKDFEIDTAKGLIRFRTRKIHQTENLILPSLELDKDYGFFFDDAYWWKADYGEYLEAYENEGMLETFLEKELGPLVQLIEQDEKRYRPTLDVFEDTLYKIRLILQDSADHNGGEPTQPVKALALRLLKLFVEYIRSFKSLGDRLEEEVNRAFDANHRESLMDELAFVHQFILSDGEQTEAGEKKE